MRTTDNGRLLFVRILPGSALGPHTDYMRTERQAKGPAGTSAFSWDDSSGTAWTVTVIWGFIGGRVECVGLSLDSDGKAAVTSTVVREVERVVRDKRAERAKQAKDMANVPGEVGRRARRQVAGWEAPSQASPGRRRDHDKWHSRALAMRQAWEERRPMLQALRDLEPGLSDDTYRKNIDRTRAWDRETGGGLLDGVGRARKDTE